MFWSNEHDVFLCREVVNLNPFTFKKGSTQRSGMWEKIAQILNECTVLRFSVDKRSVRDHMGILVNKHKRKVRAEEKASGIAPDEPSEMENLLDTIIALEESSEAESQELRAERNEKCENDRAKAEDARLKAMEKLSETRKRSSESEEEKPKRQRRSGSEAMEFLADRAKMNYELKQQEFKMLQEQQALEREKMEAMAKQQLQTQQQQTEMFKVMQQQQQQNQLQLINTQMMMIQQQQEQSRAMMALLEKLANK